MLLRFRRFPILIGIIVLCILSACGGTSHKSTIPTANSKTQTVLSVQSPTPVHYGPLISVLSTDIGGTFVVVNKAAAEKTANNFVPHIKIVPESVVASGVEIPAGAYIILRGQKTMKPGLQEQVWRNNSSEPYLLAVNPVPGSSVFVAVQDPATICTSAQWQAEFNFEIANLVLNGARIDNARAIASVLLPSTGIIVTA